MFERYDEPILTHSEFFIRMLRCVVFAAVLLTLTLLLGTIMFRSAENFSWVDAFFSSVLIITGIGMEATLRTPVGKLFTAFYALFSTMIFYMILGILFTPLLHRLLHHFHFKEEL
jgi:hypothetical protein